MKKFGRIDAVVNNAGILRDRMFFNMSEHEWRAVIETHLHGAFLVSRAAAPHFKEQKAGAYVHFTSASGLIGNLGQANYAAPRWPSWGCRTPLRSTWSAFMCVPIVSHPPRGAA